MKYGYHYFSSLKLKDKTERMALDRVIEKMMVGYSRQNTELNLEAPAGFVRIEEMANAEYQ